MPNENTPKIATKTKKTSITGLKKSFYSISHYAREAEIIEKNGHRMCFISEWMIYGSVSPSQRALQHWVFVADAANIARVKHCVQLFSQTSDFPIFFFLRHGMFLVSRSTAKSWAIEQMRFLVKKEGRKTIMVNITCFLFVKQLSTSLFTMKTLLLLTFHLQSLHFWHYTKLPLL